MTNIIFTHLNLVNSQFAIRSHNWLLGSKGNYFNQVMLHFAFSKLLRITGYMEVKCAGPGEHWRDLPARRGR